MKKISAITFFLCLALTTTAGSQNLRKHDYESVKFRQNNIRNRLSFSLSQDKNRPDIFVLRKEGRGDFYKYRNVEWLSQAELIREDSLWTTLSSRTTIKDKAGKLIAVHEKIYDHPAKKIRCVTRGSDGTITSELKFPIKGRTCDDVTMFLFLEDFVHGRNIPPFRFFYLLTNEPHYYRTSVRLAGEENLALATGSIRTLKFKLTAELGIIDDLLDRFSRHTYVWYQIGAPYSLIRYQGYEKGRGSAYIQTTLTSKP